MDTRERIKTLMERQGITYRDLAEEIGIPRSTLHNYVKNKEGKIPISFIEKVAKPLHTTPEYLMGWVDDVDEKRNEIFAKRKVLFDMTEKVKPEDLDMIINMVERLAQEDG